MLDIGMLLAVVIIFCLVYFLILETSTKKHVTETMEGTEGTEGTETMEGTVNKTKLEPVFVYFKATRPPRKLKKKTNKHYIEHENKPLYFSLNKILRHFRLTDDFDKKEIMQLNYIPDNFDFNMYVNKNNGNNGVIQDAIKLNEILPNHMVKILMELDDNIQETSGTPIKKTNITYKKNKVTLKTADNFFLNIKYSRYPKPEYEIAAINQNIVESVLKLRQISLKNGKKKKYIYYLKFPNDHYLCINKNLILYSSKDKNKIFYFEMIPLSKFEFEN